MRLVAKVLVASCMLVGCDKGKQTPSAPGTIRGHVTQTVIGGAVDQDGHFSTTSSALECTVRIIDAAGNQIGDAKSDATTGAFELQVAPGHYKVSFAACGGDWCGPNAPKIVEVDVKSGGVADASWGCSAAAG